jgi:hypothetical protein
MLLSREAQADIAIMAFLLDEVEVTLSDRARESLRRHIVVALAGAERGPRKQASDPRDLRGAL